MPTEFSETFKTRAETLERRLGNLSSEVQMRLTSATGTPEEVVAAHVARADYVEQQMGDENVAKRLRETAIPKPEKIRNLAMLQEALGDEQNYSQRLKDIIEFIDTGFPELDNEDKLYLQRDTLRVFTNTKQTRFLEDEDSLDHNFSQHFGVTRYESGDSNLHATFAKHNGAGNYRAVVNVDPGSTHQTTRLGEVSEHAQELMDMVTSLYEDVTDGVDTLTERREAEREAAREEEREERRKKANGGGKNEM